MSRKTKTILSLCIVMFVMLLPAVSVFAEDPTPTPPPEPMEQIIGATTNIFTLTTDVIGFIVDTPVLLFILAASLVPVGIRIFRSVKRT